MVTVSLRVVVLAHHRLLAQALTEALSAEPGFDVVDGAASASPSLEHLEADVLVVDVGETPGRSLDLVQSALRVRPQLGVVLISPPGPPQRTAQTREALELGVRGWVASDEPLAHLVSAVRTVGADDVFIPVTVLTSLLTPDTVAPAVRVARLRLRRLSPRQTAVLLCLAEGRSRAEAGVVLHLSENTVRTHVGAILRRLQVHSVLAAVALAREAELVGRTVKVSPTTNDVAGLGRWSGAAHSAASYGGEGFGDGE